MTRPGEGDTTAVDMIDVCAVAFTEAHACTTNGGLVGHAVSTIAALRSGS